MQTRDEKRAAVRHAPMVPHLAAPGRVVEVTLADVVAGKLPAHVTELVELEDAWRSFGDPPD